VFQNFVNELENFYNKERPIQRSQSRLKNYQRDAINPALTGYNVSSILNLYLWSSLSAPPIGESGQKETEKEESIVGCLNHAGYVIPLSRHFLKRLRLRILIWRHKKQQITLSRDKTDNLKLWVKFLQQAKEGISLNCVTIQTPSKLGWSDSCPFDLGGFLLSGRAWRIQIPSFSPIYGVNFVNNVLDFLAMLVTIWLTVLECK
jgi:hypothetical protein